MDNEFVTFLKDILMLEDNAKVGLSQFKKQRKPSAKKPMATPKVQEVKLSDLMRGAR